MKIYEVKALSMQISFYAFPWDKHMEGEAIIGTTAADLHKMHLIKI